MRACAWIPTLLFCVCSCQGAENAQENRAAEAGSPAWLFQKRVERIDKACGNTEVERMLQDELEESLYVWESEQWYQMVVAYLKDKGTPASLPILEQWLSVDPKLHPYPPEIASLREMAGEAWYAIKLRQCKTAEEKKSLARMLIDPSRSGPRITPSQDFLAAALHGFLPESRVWIYDLLVSKTQLNEDREDLFQIEHLFDVPDFAPSETEAVKVMSDGGELGRYLMALFLWSRQPEFWPNLRDAVKRFWLQAIRNKDDLYLAWKVAPVAGMWKHDEDLLNAMVETLGDLQTKGLSESRERLKCALITQIGIISNDWPDVRDRGKTACLEYLVQNPVLDWRALGVFQVKPGRLDPTEAGSIERYRQEGRKSAIKTLVKLGVPEEEVLKVANTVRTTPEPAPEPAKPPAVFHHRIPPAIDE